MGSGSSVLLTRTPIQLDVDIVAIVHSPHTATLLEARATLIMVTKPLSTGASAEVTGQVGRQGCDR